MDAGESEELLYTILSEELFKNHIFLMTEETDYCIVSDYVSQNFGMLIGETMTYLNCCQNNLPRVLKDDSFVSPL